MKKKINLFYLQRNPNKAPIMIASPTIINMKVPIQRQISSFKAIARPIMMMKTPMIKPINAPP